MGVFNIREYIEISSDASRHELAVNGGFETGNLDDSCRLRATGPMKLACALRKAPFDSIDL